MRVTVGLTRQDKEGRHVIVATFLDPVAFQGPFEFTKPCAAKSMTRSVQATNQRKQGFHVGFGRHFDNGCRLVRT